MKERGGGEKLKRKRKKKKHRNPSAAAEGGLFSNHLCIWQEPSCSYTPFCSLKCYTTVQQKKINRMSEWPSTEPPAGSHGPAEPPASLSPTKPRFALQSSPALALRQQHHTTGPQSSRTHCSTPLQLQGCLALMLSCSQLLICCVTPCKPLCFATALLLPHPLIFWINIANSRKLWFISPLAPNPINHY